MPVRSHEEATSAFMDDLSVMPLDVDALYPNTELLLSDDIWKKFELDFPELSGFDDIFDGVDAAPLFPLLDAHDICAIRHHDCMWAGHCASKEHPADEPRAHAAGRFAIFAPAPLRAPVAPLAPVKQENVVKQQSLLKPAVRAAAAAVAHAPQTPPMSDDEEARSKPTRVLQILNQAISECDLEDDSDIEDDSGLREYFGDGEDMELNVTDNADLEALEAAKSNMRKYQYAAESDHSYHKDKNASMRMVNLGIDTPSDSEEEIDVVSVGDKLAQTSRIVCSLPTNPSTRDRHQIQRRMATAIGKRKTTTNGIKTILPIRKSPAADASPAKRRTAESRGVKRSRQCRGTPTSSPYKKRQAYGHSSDSEPEPSEKRSLHNNMERQRRIDLRNAFEDLRLLVPEVSKKERAAKVVILREAALYCDILTDASHSHTRQLDELKRHQERLRGRVSQLRRSLAAKR